MSKSHSVSSLRRRIVAGIIFLAMCVLSTSFLNACTIFCFVYNGQVLMGNNEDFVKRGAVWFVPGTKDRFARVNFGFHNSRGVHESLAQGSMNEKGLAFDAAVTPPSTWVADPNKEKMKNLPDVIMDHCSSVEEVVAYFEKYNCPYLGSCQFMFADSSGASVVVAWMPKTGLSITHKTGAMQVITNSRLEESAYRCQRWVTVSRELNSNHRDGIAAARSALQATHQHGPHAFTSYSCIYDLKNCKVHLYNLTNYDEVVTLDLADEIAKGTDGYLMKNIFSDSPKLSELKAKLQRVDYATKIRLSPEKLAQFAGLYAPESAPDVRVQIEATETGLTLSTPGQSSSELFPESDNVFRIAPDRGQLTFDISASGEVTGLTLNKRIDQKARRVDK